MTARSTWLMAALPFAAAFAQATNFVATGQPQHSSANLWQQGPLHLRGRSPELGANGKQQQGSRGASSTSTNGQMALLAGLSGLLITLAVRPVQQNRSRRRAAAAVGAGVARLATVETEPPAASATEQTEPKELARKEDLEAREVQLAIKEFVPKISALQDQAELLRSGELQDVIATMKDRRRSELRSVFGEVDQLLCALVSAIHGLRESAISIRQSELRQSIEKLDRDAQAWVGHVEKKAVETLNSPSVSNEVDTLMEVHVVGLSHHTAPVEIREKLAVPEHEWNKFSRELGDFACSEEGPLVPEVAVLSTCNRFEIYFASPELRKFTAAEKVVEFLCERAGVERAELDKYLFQHWGSNAITHLFEVASGLDSLVLGEAQILAQVKACHERSIEKGNEEQDETAIAGSGGKIIAKMLNAAIRMGKLARTKTKIGKGAVSVSSAAVELMMQRALPDLRKYANNLHVSIIGAGKMSRLLLLALFSKHPDIELTLVNRSVDNAQALLDEVSPRGGTNAKTAPMTEMMDVVSRSDVVFTATAATDPILTGEMLKDIGKRLMLVDISVPRNVSSCCEEVEDVASYSVDDLKKIQEANNKKRQKEVLKAKKLIQDQVQAFKVWQASQGAVPYLAALQARAELIRKGECDKMAKRLRGLHEKEREAVDKLTRHIIDALFRPIYYSVKVDEDIETKKSKIWALKNLFHLEPMYKRGTVLGPAKARRQLDA